MSWERESLFAKAKLYFERAFEEDKEDPFFGLWCAMGLELLARSAISSVSPTLLAEPDPSHQNLLHALGLGSTKNKRKSLMTAQVLNLCKNLITDFTDEHLKISSAMINQRNEELHTGSAAFGEYSTSHWLAGFYNSCKILSEFQGESLNSLLGDDTVKEANIILSEVEEQVISKTNSLISAHKRVFANKPDPERLELRKHSENISEMLANKGHHKVDCPSCDSIATVIGEPYGKVKIDTSDNTIVERQSILPVRFFCNACELKLDGYYALTVAKLSNHYTRRVTYRPEEYFNMIRSDDYDTI